jgi:hypothetical protein
VQVGCELKAELSDAMEVVDASGSADERVAVQEELAGGGLGLAAGAALTRWWLRNCCHVLFKQVVTEDFGRAFRGVFRGKAYIAMPAVQQYGMPFRQPPGSKGAK